jgi:hypothetical protein
MGGDNTSSPSDFLCTGKEFNMDKRYLKATAFVLGVFTGASAMAGISASSAYGQTNVAPAGASQCDSAVVNDAGTTAGTCAVNNVQNGFVKLPNATSSTPLAPTSQSCTVTAASNSAAGSETIVGSCDGGTGVDQAVAWQAAAPTAPPKKLRPLAGDRKTKARATNAAGVVVGASIAKGTKYHPVSWGSNGQATALAIPANRILTLGEEEYRFRCSAFGINDATPPSIIGDCKRSSQAKNRIGGNLEPSVALLWQGTNSTGVVIGTFCTVGSINLAGQIAGECHTSQVQIVVWAPGGATHTSLSSIQGATQEGYMDRLNPKATINNQGVIVGTFQQRGVATTFYWDTRNGNQVGSTTPIPANATGDVVATAIGNNGKIVGNYSAGGKSQPFTVEPGGTVVVGGSSPAGGPNATVSSLSPSGVNEVIVSEDPTLHKQPEVQTTP